MQLQGRNFRTISFITEGKPQKGLVRRKKVK